MNERTRSMTYCALFAALLAVCSQIAIPLPAIPINLALFAVHLAGAVLGPIWGTASVGVYVTLGLLGVPVFAGFRSGAAALFGKTGGYILGYLLCALIVGLWTRRLGRSLPHLAISMVIGVAVCYAFGTAWFMMLSGMALPEALAACVLPFLPGDAVKIALAIAVDKALERQNLLPQTT